MSYRQPKKLSGEQPNKRLDPQDVKARSTAQRQEGHNSERQAQTQTEYHAMDIDEFLSYDDNYDDVRHYNGGYRRGPSTSRRVVGKILCWLQAAVSILLFAMLIKLNVLSLKYLAIAGAALVVLWILIFISQRKRRNKGQAVGMVISIILSLVMVIGSLYLVKTDQVIDTITTRSYDISNYDVVVRADDAAQTIEDARTYTFAIQPSFSKAKLDSVISDIETDLGGTINTVEMTSVMNQADALLNGEVDAIIYNDAFTSTVVEQYSDFESQTKILKSYTVKTETEAKAVDVDVTNNAFLVFISGSDSEGTVSLTGRSDVNILAGINTTTNQIVLITIPRDYYVEFPGITAEGSRDKLTHAGIYGMDELLSTVGNLLDCEINYYIRVNFSSMVEIVDALGGVEIDNEQEFTSIDGYEYPAGHLTLDGIYALNYVRERHAFEDGDFARGRHQVQVIQAMMDKLISVNTLTNYNTLADALSDFAAMNIPADDIKDLIKYQLNSNPQWHIVTYQMLGDVMMQPCQAADNAYLYVDMPYVESIDNAEILLKQLFEGETLSEDLQLTDNGQLTYVTTPIS